MVGDLGMVIILLGHRDCNAMLVDLVARAAAV